MQKRVLTTLTLGPFLLYLLGIASPTPAWIVAVLVLVMAHRELVHMLASRPQPTESIAWFRQVPFTGLALVGLFAAFGVHVSGLGLLVIALLLVTPATVRVWQQRPLPAPLADLLTGGWIGGAVAAMVRLHEMRIGDIHVGWQANCLLVVFLAIWFGDSFAMLVGKQFGKRPLAPTISPGKTVAGAIANLVTQVMVWVIYSQTLPDRTWLPPGVAVGLGAVSAVVAQGGDLFESAIKRYAKQKDSGGMIPGHGGLLDRFDSLAWTAMVMLVAIESLRGPAGNVSLW
ncbi:MAG: phosphatidate cytidylyltransferase [Fimbriimonadaceae bacterium]|nr:phosphatidate cytidylyltransferase [Fimbriimonadaceae bacterium]